MVTDALLRVQTFHQMYSTHLVGQTLNAYDAGGNALSAIFTLAAWSGAEKEEAAPFNADTTDKEQEMINTMTANGESLRYDSYVHLQNADCLDYTTRIKLYIKRT